MAFVQDYLIPLMWATAFVMAWSLLYRENFAFRIAENLTIGLFLGFTVYTGLTVIYSRVIQAYGDFAAGSITGIALISVYIAALLGFSLGRDCTNPPCGSPDGPSQF
jgi:FtsH-binding integral membrane protein